MENILQKLLVADNATILQGTNELRQAFKSPDAIPALCNVLSTSRNPQIRQYAAVLLRKRLSKQKQWCKLPPAVQQSIREGILQVLVNEKEKFVKNSVAQFVATVAKNEMGRSNWPELLKLMEHLVGSASKEDQELAVYTLSVLTDVALEAFKGNCDQFTNLFNNYFSSLQTLDVSVAYYLIRTMMHVVPLCESDPSLRSSFLKNIPSVVEVIKHLVTTDEEKACECLELFDEISESAMLLLLPHIPLVVGLCLGLAANTALGDTVRNKALTLVGWITRVKKKAIVRNKLVKPIVDVVFAVMCEPPRDGEEEEEDYFALDDSDESSPTTNATQTLDVLALHLPAEKLISHVMEHMVSGMESSNPCVKRAAYLALAMLAEGCADCIRNKYLKALLQFVCKGITDEAAIVRNAALFALGQLSEHLQPEISEYSSELMPILFEYLGQLCAKLQSEEGRGKAPPGVDRMFYALEVFCENLEEGLLPYLPGLMDRLFLTLDAKHSVHVQELALTTIGAAASAVKAGILPFFPKIIEHLKTYLLQEHEQETMCLQIQAIDTLGVLARTLGPEHFSPLAHETMQLGLKLSTDSDDPDLRKASFGLFGALSTVLKEEAAGFLPKIVELLIDSLKSTEGVVTHYKEEENAAFPVYEDLSDTPDEEDIEDASEASSDSPLHYSVENAYIEEKEEACLALRDIAQHTGVAFVPFLQDSFEVVYKLVGYPQDDIRKASIETLCQFCINFSKLKTPEGKQALYKSLYLVIPKASELIRMDEEREVVMGTLDAVGLMVKEIGRPVLEGEGHEEAVVNCIKDVLSQKTMCQDREEDYPESEEAEQDELLMESAGDLVPALCQAMQSSEAVRCCSQLLPLIAEKTKKKCSASQRAFFIGTIAECLSSLGPELSCHGNQVLQLLLPLAKDDHHDVRNNAIYGLGELVLHGKETIFPHYNEILVTLSNTLSKETHQGVIDNVCGALARLIVTNTSLVPMDQVLPVLLGRLPLREDHQEHGAVVKCLGHLYQLGHPMLLSHMSQVIAACCAIISQNMAKDDALNMTKEFLRSCQKDFPAEFTSVLQTLGAEQASRLAIELQSPQ